MNKAQRYSVGLSIQITCVDESGKRIKLDTATVAKILYIKPDGTSGFWTAAVLNSDEGTIEYFTTSTADLDQSGDWNIQGYVEFNDGRKFNTTPGRLHVQNNIA